MNQIIVLPILKIRVVIYRVGVLFKESRIQAVPNLQLLHDTSCHLYIPSPLCILSSIIIFLKKNCDLEAQWKGSWTLQLCRSDKIRSTHWVVNTWRSAADTIMMATQLPLHSSDDDDDYVPHDEHEDGMFRPTDQRKF